MRIGIIGLGLIGGSIAKTLKKVHVQNSYIIGYDTEKSFVDQALSEKVIDEIAPDIGSAFSGCNVIFICTPVSSILPIAKNLIPYVSKDCILTDIGSTKYAIVKEMSDYIATCHKNVYFVGGHPMTGSERSGYFASTNYLFENAYYILTPSENTPEFILFIIQKLIERLGALPVTMTPSYHDFATSVVSHLPHIIASSLVHLVKDNDDEKHLLHTLAAGGFKDITRIASSDPTIWQDICLSNKKEIQKSFKHYIDLLTNFHDALETEDDTALFDFFTSAKSYRDTFADGINANITKVYTLYVDAQDEPGIIACIATLLSSRGINIKDIGIMNHREFECGVLRIAFSSKADMLYAHELLAKHNYTLYY
ncbi:MAG: prephenate dehydrogenase/arogenate dehydrogenase family protein [Cellulosilyticaceae bacterium]